jgi:transcriptional regulator with XRE-family HTH domain
MSTKVTALPDLEASPDRLGPLLAARIRREREARGWSVAAFAEASGVSRAMISKVERAEASPTAALLGRLSGAFGFTVSTLLSRAEADGSGGHLARVADQQVWTDPETGYIRRALSPPGADPELVLVELPAGAEVPYPAASYAFLRGQCVWVLSGHIVVREGVEETPLRVGDLLAFDLSTPRDCAFRNPSQAESARYLVALARR